MTDKQNYWTGLADFTTSEMPSNAIGIVARVVTFAEGYDEFYEKVREINTNMGGQLIIIEEPSNVSDFFDQQLDKDHEIYEILETAHKFPNDVVYGEYHYYTSDDA